MKPFLPDFHGFVQGLLEFEKHPDLTVGQDVNPDSYKEVPAVFWQLKNNGQVDYGVWSCVLTLNLLVEGDPFPYTSHLYRQVRGWNEPGEAVGRDPSDKIVIGVEQVNDMTVFDTVFEDVFVSDKHVSNYVAVFELLIRDYVNV